MYLVVLEKKCVKEKLSFDFSYLVCHEIELFSTKFFEKTIISHTKLNKRK